MIWAELMAVVGEGASDYDVVFVPSTPAVLEEYRVTGIQLDHDKQEVIIRGR